MNSEINPNVTPNHKVQSLMIIVAKTAILFGILEISNSPTKLTSATPNPPGSTKMEPKIDENEKMNVDISIGNGVFRLDKSIYNAKHSKNHETMEIKVDISRVLKVSNFLELL